MCGIVGYTGNEECLPILTRGLGMLEYRGYDSAGVAFFENGKIQTVKACGKLANLEKRVNENGELSSLCGIGHTRWATHGAPSDTNSHPHTVGSVTLVHNGIIENHKELESRLVPLGYRFVSDTDTERACALIDSIYKVEGDPLRALFAATAELKGSYALGVMFADIKDKIYAIRKDSPLILSLTPSGAYLASDIPAILPYTKEYCRLEENIAAELTSNGITFFDSSLKKVEQSFEIANWSSEEAQKGGYPHFMKKEIYEEPSALKKTLTPRIENGLPMFGDSIPDDALLTKTGRIHIVACGTAMHAGLVGKYIIERLARIPVNVEIASEFRYSDPILSPESLVVLLSQSGETADTLAALRHAKARGIPTLAVVNVFGSSLAREADYTLYTLAGPEIAVASTKAYSVQSALMYLFAVKLALIKSKIDEARARELCHTLKNALPSLIEQVLTLDSRICDMASKLTAAEHLFYIGRGIDHCLCVEASLKLKEISYIHSEAYAAGELKHGTISLITDGTPLVCIMTEAALAKKTMGGVHEVLSRGAEITLICTEETLGEAEDIPTEQILVLPKSDSLPYPFATATAVQLLAYHVSALRGLDVDKPRNLAKSVTVE